MTSQIAKDAQDDKLTLSSYLLFLTSYETATRLPDGGQMKVKVRLLG